MLFMSKILILHAMLLFLLIFIGLPFLGWRVGVSVFDALTGCKKEQQNTYITHIHHHYDNRQVHLHNDTTQQEENRQIH